MFTCREVLAAERRIIAAAHHIGAGRSSRADVELALADSSARGKPLNGGQIALVGDGDQWPQPGLGARAGGYRKDHGDGRAVARLAILGWQVIGLAPTAASAIELSTDLSAPTDTLAKYADLPAGRSPWTATRWFDQSPTRHC